VAEIPLMLGFLWHDAPLYMVRRRGIGGSGSSDMGMGGEAAVSVARTYAAEGVPEIKPRPPERPPEVIKRSLSKCADRLLWMVKGRGDSL